MRLDLITTRRGGGFTFSNSECSNAEGVIPRHQTMRMLIGPALN